MSLRMAALVLLAVFGLLSPRNTIASDQNRAVSTELLIVTENHAERWKVRATLAGIDPAEARGHLYHKLHDFYDANGDGKLSLSEAQLLPTPFGMRQMAAGRVLPAIAPPPTNLDADHNRFLSISELKAYYAEDQNSDFQLTFGRAPLNSKLTKSILQAFELANGSIIDQALLTAACNRLLTRDTNGDGLISPGELIPGEKYPGTNATRLVQTGGEAVEHDLMISLFPSTSTYQ